MQYRGIAYLKCAWIAPYFLDGSFFSLQGKSVDPIEQIDREEI